MNHSPIAAMHSHAKPSTTGATRRLMLARIGWVIVATLGVGLFIASLPAHRHQLVTFAYSDGRNPGDVRAGLARLGISVGAYATYTLTLKIVFVAAFTALAAALAWRAPRSNVALVAALVLVTFGAIFPNTLDALAAAHSITAAPIRALNGVGYFAFFLFFCLFPDGRFVPRWTRLMAVCLLVLQLPRVGFPQSPLDYERFPWVDGLLRLVLLAICGGAQIYRYQHAADPVQRQQTKWIVFGFVAAISGLLATVFAGQLVPAFGQPGVPAALYAIVSTAMYVAALLPVPVTIAIAIWRYRLWEIDALVNRTIVYGTLTICVIGLYVLVVSGVGALLPGGERLYSLVASGLIAVAFQPLRLRLQRGANHLLYGERDDPYAILTRLGRRLEGALAQDDVLPTVVETVGQALKLPYAAIALPQETGVEIVAAYGAPVANPISLPLLYRHESVGQLLLGPRTPGEAFGPADRRLLADLARQIGVAVHAVRLTVDLQRARERLVAAREEERRRLRRDLHDGLGPQLASQTLTLDAARQLMPSDPTAADALLNELRGHMQAAVADVRRLVYALRPPALDDLGLVAALREIAHHYAPSGLTITVEAAEPLPPLAAAVEVAAYRIAQEALTNTARHATATSCTIQLTLDQRTAVLRLVVSDDGRGVPPAQRPGVGLISMRERATELGGRWTIEARPGGGTQVRAELPLTEVT